MVFVRLIGMLRCPLTEDTCSLTQPEKYFVRLTWCSSIIDQVLFADMIIYWQFYQKQWQIWSLWGRGWQVLYNTLLPVLPTFYIISLFLSVSMWLFPYLGSLVHIPWSWIYIAVRDSSRNIWTGIKQPNLSQISRNTASLSCYNLVYDNTY